MGKILVTIDGAAGSGKTTLARMLSSSLNIPYLDTGAMFRALALFLGEGAWRLSEKELMERLKDVCFKMKERENRFVIFINGREVGEEIREEIVGRWASNIATLRVIREFLKEMQQEVGRDSSLVAEGRDMGTVVFPGADVKFFLEASVEVRARRRYSQLCNMGKRIAFSDILREISERDRQDRERDIAPLRPAEDAIIIDTSLLSPQEVLNKMEDIIRARWFKRDL